MIEQPIKRGRGRPRKDASVSPKEKIEKRIIVNYPPIKRGRGRPRKSVGEELIKSVEEVVKHVKKEIILPTKVIQVSEVKKVEIVQPAEPPVKWTVLQQGYSEQAYQIAKPNLKKVAIVYATSSRPFLVINNHVTNEVKVHIFDNDGNFIKTEFVKSEEEAKLYATKFRM